MKKSPNKTKAYIMRFTPEEYKDLREKAADYGGRISNLIRAALRQFDDNQARKKFQIVDEYIKYWQENEDGFRRIAVNFNQAMKRINELNVAGILNENDAKGMMAEVEKVRSTLFDYIDQLESVSNKLLR